MRATNTDPVPSSHPRSRRGPMRRIGLLAALCVASSAMSASALADDLDGAAAEQPAVALDGTPRSQLVLALSHFHGAPSTSDIEAITDAPAALLVDLAADATLPLQPRQRAITALAAWPGPEARAFVEARLARDAGDDATELVLLGRTVELVAALAPADPQWAMDQVAPLAAHQDFGVREYLVHTLAALRALPQTAAEADAALMQLAIAERNPAVQRALAQVLDDDAAPVRPHRIDVPTRPSPTQTP